MTKHLLIADLHLHHLPSWRLDWCNNFITQILDMQEQEGFNNLYILGDVFEIKDKIDARVLNQFIRLYSNWHSGDVVWVTGQHDSYLPGIATLHELKDKRISDRGFLKIVDNKPLYYGENTWFVPYQRKVEDYLRQLKEIPSDSVVLTHYPIDEALPFNKERTVCLEDFTRFKRTISGDIHNYQDFTNPIFNYVGATSQRDWRDKNVEGQLGVLEYDAKTGKENFYRIPTNHPIHLEVNLPDEIPDEGNYIVKIKKGFSEHLKKDNVIAYAESINTSDAVVIKDNVDPMQRVESYMAKNTTPSDSVYRDFARNLLNDVK